WYVLSRIKVRYYVVTHGHGVLQLCLYLPCLPASVPRYRISAPRARPEPRDGCGTAIYSTKPSNCVTPRGTRTKNRKSVLPRAPFPRGTAQGCARYALAT